MRALVIDYVLDGTRRGYAFTTPTDGMDAASLKSIWRGAMPRGAGWGEAVYRHAVSLKCFPVESGEIALCDVRVTDLQDELGRTGIRRAEIHLHTLSEHQRELKRRLAALPPALVADAEAKLTSREWQLLFKKRRDGDSARSLLKPQTILAHPYTPEGWRFIEACLLLLATYSTLLANLIEVTPALNPFADRALSFTTLALDYRDETRIVALPAAKARQFTDAPIIELP